MFFTREKNFLSNLTKCLDLYSEILNKILFENSLTDSSKSSIDNISNMINETYEYLYYDSFIPLLRGDYINVTSELSNLVIKFKELSDILYSQSQDEINKVMDEYVKTNLIKLSEIIKQISESFKEDNWNIKLIHTESKKILNGLRKESSKYITNNSNKTISNTIYILLLRYFDALENFFNSIIKPVIRIQY